MPELYIHTLNTDNAALEEASATRERLRGAFPPGASRRMTQLGMLVGSVLGPLTPVEQDAIVYASSFGESRSLEAYLDSFPSASPTLFQTSIHPSGVQQFMIGRQIPCSQLFPVTGASLLVVQSLLTAALTGAPRTILCGGDERGSWLAENRAAALESFAFAMSLGSSRLESSLGRLFLDTSAGEGELGLHDWFMHLHQRTAFEGWIAPDWKLKLEWF